MARRLAPLLILGLTLSLFSACKTTPIVEKEVQRFKYECCDDCIIRSDGETLRCPEGWIYLGNGRIRPQCDSWMPFTTENGELVRISPPTYEMVEFH